MNLNNITLMACFIFTAVSVPSTVNAQQYNRLIANPFVFCSLPRPCKLCQPFRRIYKEICSNQSGANNLNDRDVLFTGSPDQINTEIDRLTLVLASENELLAQTSTALGQCIDVISSQENSCAKELAAYGEQKESVDAYSAEIARLHKLLRQSDSEVDCRKNRRLRECGGDYQLYER